MITERGYRKAYTKKNRKVQNQKCRYSQRAAAFFMFNFKKFLFTTDEKLTSFIVIC